MHSKDETELIAQSLDANADAYGALVDRYKNAIFHHCYAIVRNEDVAEDIAQETFITAYYKLRQYRKSHKFSTWLFKIATHKAIDWLRKAAREVAADDDVIAAIASPHPGPDKQAVYTELHEAVRNLGAKHRAVISLYYWEGLSYQEIAIVLSAPVGSVRGWIHRAKEVLRKELS